MNREILRLTLPNIITNITVPLLGIVDLAIMGRYGGDRFISAMAIGTAIFNLIYWNFGFLRMGTSGLTAQAYGAKDHQEAVHTLIRGLLMALVIAFFIWMGQSLLLKGALEIMEGSDQVRGLASDYFRARIWAAPATLSMYAFTGWFIGMQNAKIPMWIAIVVNLVNIFFSFWLVVRMHMGITGVAWGTVIAQYSGILLAMSFFLLRYRKLLIYVNAGKCFEWNKIKRFFDVNKDIFLRTVCLVVVFTFFTSASSSLGDTTLAVNALLLQLFTLFSYVMDGFAYAGEALVGRFVGAGDRQRLKLCIRYLIRWGVGIALVFSLLYAGFLEPILSVFTESEDLIYGGLQYRWWISAVPLVSFLAFIYDGILVGWTRTRIMRNCMFAASVVFFLLYYGLVSALLNMALWIAFLSYLFLRGILQMLFSSEILVNSK